MDFWAWWASVEPRTDWIAIIVGFFATLVSTGLAVLIALWIQRRDFSKRAKEMAEQNSADAEVRRADLATRTAELEAQAATESRQRRDDWRRTIVSKAFDVLNEAAGVALQPYLAGDRNPDARRERVVRDVESLQMEFRLDVESGGNNVGEWFKRAAMEILGATSPDVPGLMARARFELTEWASGGRTSDHFSSI